MKTLYRLIHRSKNNQYYFERKGTGMDRWEGFGIGSWTSRTDKDEALKWLADFIELKKKEKEPDIETVVFEGED